MIGRRYLHLLRELRPSDIFKEDSLSPRKIALQIILLQLFYYFTAAVLFYGWGTFFGYDIDIKKWLFSWEAVDFTNSVGLSVSVLWLVDALICVIFLTVIVGRSKLAWDFAITIHAINLIIVFFYTGSLPSLQWLLIQVLSMLILVFLGTWTSRWKELRDTFFEGLLDSTDGLPSLSNNNSGSESNPNNSIQMKDLESQR
ncbi:hypothetical protein Kpol_534p52 [Vanderwaltozyma polyspora DSM 70294]|uniref:Protein SYS1 n=1 Tax=Vanderwaltozyma polyspora (strain ATCC 22028 / DSM 70294 / BCRC 21397 / CBS 2163 / NBRC 10782 / NRRL Y-8283 / UCD 57-17) TaxID=436907 RepID=A7TJM8_VANPO|nr:uncharacterized protein Kpol_534p52 [Vanderwaltozyma polyspora DSM 70294]EDO17571.1 hypothetical protein Kpol_534p52 [Vanderwaltozyma polyspora DSM 70294]